MIQRGRGDQLARRRSCATQEPCTHPNVVLEFFLKSNIKVQYNEISFLYDRYDHSFIVDTVDRESVIKSELIL